MNDWRTFGPKLTEKLRQESFNQVGDAYRDSLKNSFMDATQGIRRWWLLILAVTFYLALNMALAIWTLSRCL